MKPIVSCLPVPAVIDCGHSMSMSLSTLTHMCARRCLKTALPIQIPDELTSSFPTVLENLSRCNSELSKLVLQMVQDTLSKDLFQEEAKFNIPKLELSVLHVTT